MVFNWGLFLTLLVAHLLADFPLQTDSIYRLKIRGWYGIIPHAAIHAAVLAILIGAIEQYWPVLVLVFVLHFLVDWAKLHVPFSSQSVAFICDQMAHVAVLTGLTIIAPQTAVLLPTSVLFVMALYALIPAFLMFASILYQDVQVLALSNRDTMAWSRQFFELSHVTGWPLLVALVAMQIFHGLR